MLKLATPEESVLLPSVLAPDFKMTVPVGAPPLDVTVAVKITEAPNVLGLIEDVTAIVATALFTVCVCVDDMLPRKLLLPP